MWEKVNERIRVKKKRRIDERVNQKKVELEKVKKLRSE